MGKRFSLKALKKMAPKFHSIFNLDEQASLYFQLGRAGIKSPFHFLRKVHTMYITVHDAGYGCGKADACHDFSIIGTRAPHFCEVVTLASGALVTYPTQHSKTYV